MRKTLSIMAVCVVIIALCYAIVYTAAGKHRERHQVTIYSGGKAVKTYTGDNLTNAWYGCSFRDVESGKFVELKTDYVIETGK